MLYFYGHMCGIAGIYAFTEAGRAQLNKITAARDQLKHRGPDVQASVQHGPMALAHARLSIIDLSEASNQPLYSQDRQQVLTFNGEIYNYQHFYPELPDLHTTGDSEVLLRLFQRQKTECLNRLNGFFAFAYADLGSQELYLVRDRLGIKPLYYYQDENLLVWASEIRAILAVIGPQRLEPDAMRSYIQLNYMTGSKTVFSSIRRLMPGHYIHVKDNKASLQEWFRLKGNNEPSTYTGDFYNLLEDAVKLRLYADVPVGSFLSGGLDSSIISALAARHHSKIYTFSIGFKDEPFFDESAFANQVAQHIGSDHHAIRLGNNELLDQLDAFLNAIDEPFADSSALNMFILSQYTSRYVKVALSGDGADELFMGYNKHKAEWLSRRMLYRSISPVLKALSPVVPQSRNSAVLNKLRQMVRFSKAVSLSPRDRYLAWASITDEKDVEALLKEPGTAHYLRDFLGEFEQGNDWHRSVNIADLRMVLADDMLVKVDRMSMYHGLEVRNPFLDYRVVRKALQLPFHQKMAGRDQKIILKETFAGLLPENIFTRRKKGFELPLLKWLRNELNTRIEQDWLNDAFVREQGLFEPEAVKALQQQLHSSNPGDAAARIWALIVFQQWYKTHSSYILK